ncbi:MAG TPA: VOC family protein, partial [Longimicrobiales bacterium]
MTTRLNPYLNFRDNARQAIEFYHSVLGGKLDLTTFKDGGMSQGPADANLVMHSQLEADNGMTLMASDTPPGMDFKPGTNISISLSGDDEKTLRGYWDKLSAGGMVMMPLEKAPWGDTFGMCTDKFGIQWLVNIAGKAS